MSILRLTFVFIIISTTVQSFVPSFSRGIVPPRYRIRNLTLRLQMPIVPSPKVKARGINLVKQEKNISSNRRMGGFTLRPYQSLLCEKARGKNIIVLLPTGAGKTLVGAEIIQQKLHDTGKGKLVIFLVPTCFLVAQQANEIRSWLDPSVIVGEFSGSIKAFPDLNHVDVLVCTPQSFVMKQRLFPDFLGWGNISLLIFDEVHHVLKDHPYRKIALSLKQFKAQQSSVHGGRGAAAAEESYSTTQVVGLTALLTYAVAKEKIIKAQEELTKELAIDVMPHISKEQLQADGFHAGSGTVTEVEDQVEVPDIFESDKVVPESDRQPHLMHSTFWSRIKNRQATSFAKELVEIIQRIEIYFNENSPFKFDSPIHKPQLASWGQYASQQGKRCKKTAVSSWKRQYLFLEHWYEALRIVVTNWEEAKGLELAVLFLQMMETKTDMRLSDIPIEFGMDHGDETLSGLIDDFLNKYNVFPHFSHITHQLLRMKLQKRQELRAIIFVQQKTTAHILTYHLNRDIDIMESDLSAVALHSTTTGPPSPSIPFSPTDAKQSLESFSSGLKTILVTTTVAEEGMDIPKSNCVIRFDPVQTGVSLVQGRGRARQEESFHIITAQRSDRPMETFENVETLQAELALNFVPSNVKTRIKYK